MREDNLQRASPKDHSQHDYDLLPPSKDGSLDKAGTVQITPKANSIASHWYSVVGKPKVDAQGDLNLILRFAALGMIGYTAAFKNMFSLPSYN